MHGPRCQPPTSYVSGFGRACSSSFRTSGDYKDTCSAPLTMPPKLGFTPYAIACGTFFGELDLSAPDASAEPLLLRSRYTRTQPRRQPEYVRTLHTVFEWQSECAPLHFAQRLESDRLRQLGSSANH